MVADDEPSIERTPSPEKCILNRWFLTIFGLIWPLTFRPQNLLSSSVPTAWKLSIWWNSHQRFTRHRVNKLSVYNHTHTHAWTNSLKAECFQHCCCNSGRRVKSWQSTHISCTKKDQNKPVRWQIFAKYRTSAKQLALSVQNTVFVS